MKVHNIKVKHSTYERLRRVREGMRLVSSKDFTMEQVVKGLLDSSFSRGDTDA